jgi:hypothetical protein
MHFTGGETQCPEGNLRRVIHSAGGETVCLEGNGNGNGNENLGTYEVNGTSDCPPSDCPPNLCVFETGSS